MKKFFFSLLLAGLFLPLVPTLALAQNEVPEEELGDDTQYSYATVVSVSDKEIVVSEYDYEKDESVNVTYSLDPALKLRNINSVKEIVVDDAVEIIYTAKDGKKMATAIAVDKNTGEEPMEGGEEPTEQPEEEAVPNANVADNTTPVPDPSKTPEKSEATTVVSPANSTPVQETK